MNRKSHAILLGLVSVILWAGMPAVFKVGVDARNLSLVLTLRFLISSVFFINVVPAVIQKMPLFHPLQWLLLAVILGCNYFFQSLAMLKLPISWYLVIFSLSPLLSILLTGIKVTPKLAASFVVCIVGTVLFLNQDDISQTYGFLPFVYLLFGMLTWVAYTVFVRKFHSVYTDAEIACLTQIVSLASCSLVWGLDGEFFFRFDHKEIFSILGLGLLTPFAYYCFSVGLKFAPRFTITAQYLEPVVGVFIAFLFFHDQMSFEQAMGSVLIIAGAGFAAFDGSGKKKESENAVLSAADGITTSN